MLDGLNERDRALAQAALAQGVVDEGQLRQALSAPPPFAGALRELAGGRAWQLDVIEQGLGAAAPAALARWEPGEVVEGYTIQRLLGEGGMGKVFLVQDASGKAFALKTLAREADPDLRGRFRREGEAQARADGHPNVLRVRSSGELAGEAFLVLDVAEGGDLSERLRDGPLEIGAVFELGIALAGAIHHAHEQGVLHRDLKPSNVLFDESGAPKVCDFGLAALQGAESLTQTGASLGTPSYMAPEQADSTRGEIGPATDVYGLGAVLFSALTGNPPFGGGGRMRVVSALLLKEAPRARSLRKDVPPALDAVLEICLRKEPEARFPSAAALRDALEDARRGVVPNRRNPGRRRRGFKRASLLVLLVASLCAAVGAVVYATRGQRLEVPAQVVDPAFEILLEQPAALTYSKVYALSGRVSGEGAERVRVGSGRPTKLDLEGRFRVRVRLAEGPNTLRVEALDLKGAPVAVLEHEVRFMRTPSWWRRLAESKRPPLPLPEGLAFGEAVETYDYKEGSVLVWVPPGSFTMGRPDDAFVQGVSPADQHGARKLEVKLTYGYFIGKYEVTWGQYEAYCRANKIEVHDRKLNFRLERKGAGIGVKKTKGEGSDFLPDEGYPVHGVSWLGADQYTRFYGLRLPTEPEWEYAARGNQVGNFPWGDQPPGPGLLNRFDPADGYPYTAPVDSFAAGASPFGCFHMAGNVREYTSSFYAPYPEGPVQDWKGGPPADSYVSRGWGFTNVDPEAYTVYRRWPAGVLRPGVEYGMRVALSHPAFED